MASAEHSPLARTGGLGEAVAGLASALIVAGIDVTVAIPRYQHLFDLGEPTDGVVALDSLGVPVVLIDEPEGFDRPGIYGPQAGAGHEDQWLRFGLFAKRVREMSTGFDVLHLHDGHPAPAAIGATIPTVQTIHNASYPILGPLDKVGDLLELSEADLVLGGPIEWYGDANFLKAGVDRAGAVTTVSPTFAMQISEDSELSGGLDVVLRARPTPVIGILNGIDTTSWNPANDRSLPSPYSSTRLEGRTMAKAELLAQSGLTGDGVLFGNVGRLAEQKGLQLLDPFIGDLVQEAAAWTEAAQEAMLVDFLTSFGVLVGRGPHFRLGGSIQQPRLFTIIVGDTARGRKGASRDVVHTLTKEADYKTHGTDLNLAPGWTRAHYLKGLTSGEGLIAAVERNHGDGRMLIVEGELARLITAAAREGSTLSPLIRDAYDTNSLRVANKIDLAPVGDVPPGMLPTSATLVTGIDRLVSAIAQRLVPAAPPAEAPVPFADEHVATLHSAIEQLTANASAHASQTLRQLC